VLHVPLPPPSVMVRSRGWQYAVRFPCQFLLVAMVSSAALACSGPSKESRMPDSSTAASRMTPCAKPLATSSLPG